MLKTIAVILLIAVAVIVALALKQPETFRAERSITIAARPEGVAPLISDLHNWPQWSPWAHLDHDMKVTYSGAASGVGSVYEWEGNRKVGKGRMEITSATPSAISLKLDFIKPMEGHNSCTFTLQSVDSSTHVTWEMDGPNTFMGKVMSVFVSMDKMIGKDFEKGLANLKAAAEKP
jgi:hypothetical protein